MAANNTKESRPILSTKLFASEIITVLCPEGSEGEDIILEEREPLEDFEVIRKCAETVLEIGKEYVDETLDDLKRVYQRKVLLHYAHSIKKYFRREGLDLEKLLYFSAYVSLIAIKLYEEGETANIDRAFWTICMLCDEFNILKDGWDSLQEAASRILQRHESGKRVPPYFLDFVSLEEILEETDYSTTTSTSDVSHIPRY